MVGLTKKDAITGELMGTGRRKSSVASVRVSNGTGKITINGKEMKDFFVNQQDQKAITDALDLVGKRDSLDIRINVKGGGLTGQSGACRMGLARALVSMSEENFQPLRDNGFMTRDSRMKERKKCGLHGARKGTQFSKR
ncbi:MAG: 30S ribosomal protein S9 [Pirellulaceae bacterium]|jgi:small subunit ribosomal protein S9|nr:30S ribosomal protein S9 [Pirellulaceae bacterium]